MGTEGRSRFGFQEKVRNVFSFLEDLGFSEIEATPTLVRYQNGDVEIDIYHGRQSYEIGAGVSVSGDRYAISEILKASNTDQYRQYRNAMVSTSQGVNVALEELGKLMKRYGATALKGDPLFVARLKKQREKWSSDFSQEVLASQLLPQADDAFRQKDYARAAALYSQIRERLSAAELKKLDYSIKHSKNSQS